MKSDNEVLLRELVLFFRDLLNKGYIFTKKMSDNNSSSSAMYFNKGLANKMFRVILIPVEEDNNPSQIDKLNKRIEHLETRIINIHKDNKVKEVKTENPEEVDSQTVKIDTRMKQKIWEPSDLKKEEIIK